MHSNHMSLCVYIYIYICIQQLQNHSITHMLVKIGTALIPRAPYSLRCSIQHDIRNKRNS